MSDFSFSHLRVVLTELPLPVLDIPVVDFRRYSPSAAGLEKTESINGAVNDDLESILGYKLYGLTLRESGPGVVALADVLEHYTGQFPEDTVLAQWGPAVMLAAANVYLAAGKPIPAELPSDGPAFQFAPRLSPPPARLVTVEEVSDDEDTPMRAPARKKRKGRTDGPASSVPPWVDISEPESSSGRPPDRLARQLSILCYDSSDPTGEHQLRCVGSTSGCTYSWACPRNKKRVYKHAATCTFINPDYRQQASVWLSKNAPSVLAEQASRSGRRSNHRNASPSTNTSTPSNSSILELATTSGKKQLKATVDYDVLRFICAAGLPPVCVDRPEFKTMVEHLNNRYTPVSSWTLANNQIPAEAAAVLEKSLAILHTLTNLTLTLDGGSTRRPRSVYTFHVTTPERRVFLIRGEDTTTSSHTGDHVASLARGVMGLVGEHRFSAVVTDGASNVVRCRKRLVADTPTMLNLTDPCHKLSLLIKDVCKLKEFEEMIRLLRCTLNFFSKSTYATALLTERRALLGIKQGLDTIGKTRFGTVPKAAGSLLRCIHPIRQLVSEGAIEVPGVGDIFNPKSPASMRFEMQLTVFTAVLDPVLRALTCLESAFSTPGDVLLFFSSSLGAMDKHLSSASHGLSSSDVADTIRKLCSKRFSELINESPDDIYVTAFFLDPYFRNSRLLRNINPLTITITLNASERFSSHGPTVKMMKRIGSCLFNMLRKEWDFGVSGFVCSLYSSPTEAKDALRQQILLFSTSVYPFSEKIGPDQSAYSWWMRLADHPMCKLLAYFAIKLFSIVPNSMADERTVSTFTWLNSALRNRQDVATIVRQTQIRQFYDWNPNAHNQKSSRIRFRDLGRVKRADAVGASNENSNHESPPVTDLDELDNSEDADGWLDNSIDESGADSSDTVPLLEVGDIVDLTAPEVEDCLSDVVPPRLSEKLCQIEADEGGKGKGAMWQGDSTETDWSFD